MPGDLLPPTARVVRIAGDGNCLFRALAYPQVELHAFVRSECVAHVAEHWDRYRAHLTDDEQRAYLDAMRRTGTWGDELMLRAFSERAGARVRVHAARTGRLISEYDAPGSDELAPRVLLFSGAHYDRVL